MGKKIGLMCACAVVAVAGVFAVAGQFPWAPPRYPEAKPGECDLLLVTGGDEDGLTLLRGAYTDAGTGIWNAGYYEERMREGLVLHVDAGNLSEEERAALRSSAEGTETELVLRNDPELLDQMLDNPRYDRAAVEAARDMSGTVRGYFFGTSEISTEGPCWFEAV